MIDKKKPKLTNDERHKRFVETAKKVEASDSLDDFDKAFDALSMRPLAPSDVEIERQKNPERGQKS